MSGGRLGLQEKPERQKKPERIGALARLPLFFALEGKRAVIAGGSPAAAWKAELLAATGARVDIYAADSCAELLQFAADHPVGTVTWHRRAWTAADLPGAALAVGDFRNDAEAAAFAAAAGKVGVPVNIIDKPAYCDFSFGAIVNRSPLVIGISTDGAAPVFARAIRGRLEALLGNGFARWSAAAARWRSAVQASELPVAGRRRFWELFAAHAMAHADDEPGQHDFDRFIAKANGAEGGIDRGAVCAVDVDRDDPELADFARGPRIACGRRHPVRRRGPAASPRLRAPRSKENLYWQEGPWRRTRCDDRRVRHAMSAPGAGAVMRQPSDRRQRN